MKIKLKWIKIIIIIIIIIIIKERKSILIDVSNQALHFPCNVYRSSLSSNDFNGDGLVDLVGGGSKNSATTNSFCFLRQNFSLAFFDIANAVTFPGGVPQGLAYGAIALVDLNGDALPDLLYAGDTSSSIGSSSVYLQQAGNIFMSRCSFCFAGSSFPATSRCS